MSTGKLAKRYNPVRILGEGSMGVVWLVDDLVDRRQVAMKAISPRAVDGSRASAWDWTGLDETGPHAGGSVPTADARSSPRRSAASGRGVGITDKSVLQFKQEFRLMTQLRHPNCCAVYDYGVTMEGEPYFTMEVVSGQGLDEVGLLAPEPFKDIFTQLLLALGYLHQQGFVHRDLKSANVRLTPDGQVKLMDFGLMDHTGCSGGAIKGTIGYLAPEVIRRGTIDQRADLYALGCLAYEMWTGRLPFRGDRPLNILKAHLDERPMPPGRLRAGLEPTAEAVILKLLAKEPLERFQSAFEVLAALDEAGGWERHAGGPSLLASPMLGREAEQALLQEHLATVAGGGPGAALAIHGPAGIGKSRLVEEFRYLVQLAHLPAAQAANHEFAHSPYGPFVTILRGLLPALKAHARANLDRLAPIVVKLLPELGVPPAVDLDTPASEKTRLQGALAELLIGLADVRGLVLVLEDWQWADPLSAQFLEMLIHQARGRPLLALVTMHHLPDTEGIRLTSGSTVSSVSDGLIGWTTPLELGPLAPAAVARVVASMLGTADVDPGFLRQVGTLSEGNPAYLAMLLAHLVETGTLGGARGRWQTAIVLTPEQLPRGLRELQTSKLRRLPPSARAIAGLAAAVGYHFDLRLLKRVARVGEEALFTAVEALSQAQIFVPDADGAYRFATDQLQDVLYTSLTDEERSRHHTAIAQALEEEALGPGRSPIVRLNPDDLADLPLDRVTAIADQYMRGAVPARTIAYCLETGTRSARLYANQEAAMYLAAGLRLLQEAGSGDWQRIQLEFLGQLGDVKRMLGLFDEACQAYLAAIPAAEVLGDRARECRMQTSLAKCYQVLQQFPAALEACERSYKLGMRMRDVGETARSLLTSARIHYFRGRVFDAVADSERALDFARDVVGIDLRDDETGQSDPDMSALFSGQTLLVLGFLGYLLRTAVPERKQEGLAYLTRSVSLLTQANDKIGLIEVLDFLGSALMTQGDFTEALTTYEEKYRICEETGYRDEAAMGLVNQARASLALGQFAEGAAKARAARELAGQLNSRHPLVLALIVEAACRAYRGEVATGRALAIQAIELAWEHKSRYLETHILAYQAEIDLLAGRLPEAQSAAELLLSLIHSTGNLELEGALHAILGELLATRGEVAAAAVHLNEALAIAGQAQAKATRVRVLRTQARLAMGAGDWATARRLATEAASVAGGSGMRYMLAELELLLGEIALATGTRDAGAHFGSARDLAEAIGAPQLRALALFGQAATSPYGGTAPALAREAAGVLQALIAELDPPAAAAFMALPERRRVLEGNFVGFSLTRTRPSRGQTSTLPGLGPDSWKQI